MPYAGQVLFAVFRVILWFSILFWFAAPFFFPYVRNLKTLDRVIYGWVGLGSIVIISVFVLTQLNLYDSISLGLILFVVPFILNYFRKTKNIGSVSGHLRLLDTRLMASQIKALENIRRLTLKRVFVKTKRFMWKSRSWSPAHVALVILGLLAVLIRIFPALLHAAPFNRRWFFELTTVKSLNQQIYFGDFPEPAGMHSIISMMSTFTQVSPELLLHIFGALTVFLLSIIIYWFSQEIFSNRMPVASLFAVGVYAITPLLWMPISLDNQIFANSLELALCFAIPTLIIFARNVRSFEKSPWFFVWFGMAATAFIDVFVFLIVLLPQLFFLLFFLPRRNFFKSAGKLILKLALATAIATLPYISFLLLNGIEISDFLLSELFKALVFSYFPNLIAPIAVLSEWYLLGAIILISVILIFYRLKIENVIRGQIWILMYLIIISALYSPTLNLQFRFIDLDQLNSYYAILIAVSFGIVFSLLERGIRSFILSPKLKFAVPAGAGIFLLLFFIYIQGGLRLSNLLPNTLPNTFFKAYYSIINERIPYTYAIVSPEVNRSLSVNRHYFMNYGFFLSDYGRVDSLYHEYLQLPRSERGNRPVPPASIFLFIEKPPYGKTQQGILYNAPAVMNDMEQWVRNFQGMEGRTLNIYMDEPDAVVYEIVNMPEGSSILGALSNIYSKSDSTITRLIHAFQ